MKPRKKLSERQLADVIIFDVIEFQRPASPQYGYIETLIALKDKDYFFTKRVAKNVREIHI